MAQDGFFVIGVIIAIVAVGIGSAVGLAMLSKTDQVFQSLGPGGAWPANSPAGLGFNNTMSITYSSWPMLGLVVLAIIGASVIMAISIFR
jgi:ABC-type antimicrobial peptide transport system permease subunit